MVFYGLGFPGFWVVLKAFGVFRIWGFYVSRSVGFRALGV